MNYIISFLESEMNPTSKRYMRNDICVVKVKPMSENWCSNEDKKVDYFKYKNCQSICLEELEAYGKETSVHGLKRMLTHGTGRMER